MIFFIIMSPKQLCFPFLLKMMLDFDRHFLRPFKRLDKKALKLHFQHKNDRTKIYFIFMKLIWLKLLDDRDAIYNL